MQISRNIVNGPKSND